jgi:hypothetical protein
VPFVLVGHPANADPQSMKRVGEFSTMAARRGNLIQNVSNGRMRTVEAAKMIGLAGSSRSHQ